MERFSVKKSIKIKVLGVVLFCVFMVTAALGYLSFEFSKKRIVNMLGDSVKGISTAIASFASPEDIALILANSEKIKQPTAYADGRRQGLDLLTPRPLDEKPVLLNAPKAVYEKYSALLRGIKTVNKIDSPISIYAASANRLRLVLTSEPTLLTGDTYAMRLEARDAFLSGSAQATGIYKDKDGTWISAYAPGGYLPSDAGRVIVEINYKIDSYIGRLREELGIIIIVCIAGFFIAAFISYYLVTTLVSAIKRLDKAVGDLEEERYDKPIDVRSDDEIGHLATTFELLRKSLKKKIEELRLSLTREKRAHLESIVALTNAIETRDVYTKQHVSRVYEYALLIAKAMGLSHKEMARLRYGCLLHDIGKIYIEDSLLKKGRLTEADFDVIKKHSERGAKIIEGIQFLTDVKEVVLYHQERYDGKGYPKGLRAGQIPLMARIVAVADAFDAMTTDRPYRKKISFARAIEEIEKNSGTQFDPEVCAAFLKYKDTLEKMIIKRLARVTA